MVTLLIIQRDERSGRRKLARLHHRAQLPKMAIKASGDIAIVRFPEPDLKTGKPRPVLLITKVPGRYDDWLVCMISTQLREAISSFDEIIDATQKDFQSSGL